MISFVVTPIGIPRDEDPTDNTAVLGSITNPIVAHTRPEYHVEFFVTPENATTDITRYAPIFINNTGNVLLSDFVVTRVVSIQGTAAANFAPETKTWTTQRAAPPGMRSNLQGLSDEFDPAKDLFWKASQRSDYKFFVGVTTPQLPPSSQEKLIRSFATYFFDDVDVGPRGEAMHGDWQFDDEWSTQDSGFRSDKAYGFGDSILMRYPDNADSSAITPVIDLSGARSARFGLYTRFLFPDSFDAGVVEASADAGKTWHRLTPRPYVDENGTSTPGYGVTIAASSPLHLTHDPAQVTNAFSGDSRLLPGNTDGWIYREFDLSDFTNISEAGLPYVKFDSAALANYRGTGQTDPLDDPTHHGALPNLPPPTNSYYDSTWSTGALDKYQYWESQNLTESTVASPVGHPTIWWSGSASITDDEKRPQHNTWLNISMTPVWYEVERNADGSIRKDADGYPIPLDTQGRRVYDYGASGHITSIDAAGNAVPHSDNGVPRAPATKFEADDHVIADWWEWFDRYGLYLGPNSGQLTADNRGSSIDLASAWQYAGDGPATNIRVNVTKPTVIEAQGKWLHMQSDITDYRPGIQEHNVTDLSFVYAPLRADGTKSDGTSLDGSFGPYDDGRLQMNGKLSDDRGFAVDGFHIAAYKLVNGAPANERVLLSTEDAWNASTVEQCVFSTGADDASLYENTFGSNTPPSSDMPCWHHNPGTTMLQRGPTPSNRTLVGDVVRGIATKGSTTTLTDSSKNFTTLGAFVGDVLLTTGAVADGGSQNLVITGITNFTNLTNFTAQNGISCSQDTPCEINDTLTFAAATKINVGPGHEVTYEIPMGVLGRSDHVSPAEVVDDRADFSLSGVQPGDILIIVSGDGQGYQAPIVAVDHHVITLGAEHNGADSAIGPRSAYRIKPFVGNVGTSWAIVPQLPGLPSTWNVTDVRVSAPNGNYSKSLPLPTGETPKAWYTGNICSADTRFREAIDAKTPPTMADVSFVVAAGSDRTSIISTTRDFLALGVKAGDFVTFWSGTGAGNVTFVREVNRTTITVDRLAFTPGIGSTYSITSVQRTCLRAGSEERLVTPAIDLTRVAGDDATLTFWQRYAFFIESVGQDAFASGGVVEVQTFDPQTGWGAWQQIYACPAAIPLRDYFDAAGNLQGLLDPTNKTVAIDGEKACATHEGNATRGGYSAYTVNLTHSSNSEPPRLDPPFQAAHHVKRDGRTEDVQLLYSGNSASITHDPLNAWVPAHFDLTSFLGKQVRIGFHVAITGNERSSQLAGPSILDPVDVFPTTPAPGKPQEYDHGAGWWIANVSIVGTVLEGKPVQLRLRAVTDGNVHDGQWQFDDAGLFGSRYGRSIGVFVDQTPGAFGAFANNSTTIPLTLRNLGDTVRRDLAIEARQITSEMGNLALSGVEGQAWYLDTTDPAHPILRISGFNLAPGQSVTIPLTVGVPKSLPKDTVTDTLHIVLKEYSAPDDKYVDVPDNEVVGFLQRDVDVTGQRGVQPKFGTLSTTPAGPAVGELVNVTMDVTNPGYGPITLDLSCTATLVGSWTKLDRRKTPEPQIETSTDHQCTRAAGKSVLSSHETSSYVFQATPTAQGIMTFKINGTVSFGAGVSKVPARSLSAAIGRSSVIYHDGFMPAPKLPTAGANDPPKDGDVKYNWTHGDKPDAPGGGGGEPTFDWPRGHDEPGAMLLGIPDRMMEGGASYNMQCGGGEAGAGTCTATSPPIDLHNYTSEHLALSFWYLSKFAKGDGARVTASILVDETKADQAGVGSWISECVIQPVGGYKGYLTEYYKASSTGGDAVTDYNGYPGATGVNGNIGPNIEGFYSGQSDAWQYAVFDLFGQGCKRPDGVFESLLGHTIRINFVVFAGAPAGAMMRGNGQGWFIDDITLSPQSIDIAPPSQSAVLLDNTTKAFNVILTNTGSAPDIVRLRLDEGNSSVPRGSISVPADVTLAPKETRVVQVQVTLPRDPSLLPTLFKARILAQSLIDPAARGTSDLIIEFGPRPWAELTVHADAPGGIVQEGTESFIPITVENDGVVDSVASSVNVVDHYVTSNGIAHDDLMTLDLPSMPSYFEKAEDASRVIEFRWRPARGSVGTHTLTITADPQQLGEEYTRLNNVVVLNVNVSELLIPDLDVTTPGALKIRDASNAPVTAQKDADVTRYEVTAGELATLELKLVNHGKAGATNVDLRAFIGTLSLPPKSIPYVPPGAELTVTFNWLAQKGEYPIEVIVRTEQVEGSTTNNRNPAKGVTLLIVKGYEIKTTIADVPMDIVPPMDVKVPFNVTNSGNAGEDLVLTASAPDGWSVTLPWTSIFLSAGKTTGAIATVHVPEAAVAGEQFITIQATARENPMKVAGASTPLHVHAFYGGSIGGGSVQAAPPGITIPIELSNEGNSLEPWSVTIDLPRGWTSRETLPAKVVVPPHGSTIFNVHAIAPETTAPGDQQMLVKATLPNGEKREGFMTVGVTLLRVASVTITDDQPKETLGALAYPVTVENTGNVNAPFKVLLLGVPEGITARLDPDEFPLAPGERALATLTLTPSTSTEAGAYQITGYSLFEGVHPDTDEGKANVQSLRVTIVRPDLRMGALEYAPHTGVSAGDRVTVKVPITNRGQGTVTDLPVHLFVDDIFVSEARIPALRTGERRDATLNWTALPGQHTLTAVVDPWNDTVDAQREDNAVSTLVDIESGSSNVLTGAAKVPMPGATWILLIAAAAAILLARRERRPPR
ncbi:MAG: CARDB domain-containing protein [Candidatus Thermoplasmatota archaeon]